MKRRIKNNKGFTLVELLVTFGILAVVMVMVGAIIGMSSGTYKNISDDLNLQYESQLAMSQLQEYVIDCNDSVAWDSGTGALYLFNERTDGEKTVCDGYKLALDGNTLKLYAKKGFAESLDTFDPTMFSFDESSGQPMSGNVESFSAMLSADVRSIGITLEYALGKETYTGEQTVAFRNPVSDISAVVPVA